MPRERWFESAAVASAISALTVHRHSSSVECTETPQQQNAEIVRNVAFAAGGTALFLAVVIIALVMFTE